MRPALAALGLSHLCRVPDLLSAMLLPLTDDLIVTTPFDRECALLADRHYSRRTVGARQFAYSGRNDAGGDWIKARDLDARLAREEKA